MEALPTYFTPNQIAKSRGIDVTKVLGWIRSGELKAVNYATKRIGKPRWKISPAALDDFERLRASGPPPTPTRSRITLKPPKRYF